MRQENRLDNLLYKHYFSKVKCLLPLDRGEYGPRLVSFYQTGERKYADELRTIIIDDCGEICQEYPEIIKENLRQRGLPLGLFCGGMIITPLHPPIGGSIMLASGLTILGFLNQGARLEKDLSEATDIRNGLLKDPNAVYRTLKSQERKIRNLTGLEVRV